MATASASGTKLAVATGCCAAEQWCGQACNCPPTARSTGGPALAARASHPAHSLPSAPFRIHLLTAAGRLALIYRAPLTRLQSPNSAITSLNIGELAPDHARSPATHPSLPTHSPASKAATASRPDRSRLGPASLRACRPLGARIAMTVSSCARERGAPSPASCLSHCRRPPPAELPLPPPTTRCLACLPGALPPPPPPRPTSHPVQEGKRLVGQVQPRLRGQRTHLCVACDWPVSVYGRCAPCLHAFCLSCAAAMPQCLM